MKMRNLGDLWNCEEGEELRGGAGTTDRLCDCPVPTEHPVHHALSSDHPVKEGGRGGRGRGRRKREGEEGGGGGRGRGRRKREKKEEGRRRDPTQQVLNKHT